jgi:glycolate oxidase FAD binding subunit
MTRQPALDELLTALCDIVGAEYARTKTDTAATEQPRLLVSPGSAAEVAACLQAARDYGVAVIPWGGGTQQRIGRPPDRADLIVATGRLTGVVDWEPADLTAGVLAGTPLAAAQSLLAARGQQIAADAPVGERATVGGLVATNVCGPRRWLYGGWRDQVIGMEMALASGEVIKSGGRVVKNVQGYDLAKLFIGSLGTLGMITRVNVRLAPLPEARSLLVARGEAGRLAALLDEVADSPLRLAAVDVLDGATAGECGLGDGSGAVLLLIEGSRPFVTAHGDRVVRLAQACGLEGELIEEGAVAGVYGRWVNLSRTDDLNDLEVLLRMQTLPALVMRTMQGVAEEAVRRGLGCRAWAHAGNGAVFARLTGDGDGFRRAVAELQTSLLPQLPATTLVAGDSRLQRQAQPWGDEPDGMELMRRLKERFDPTRTLQPGRFAGGI